MKAFYTSKEAAEYLGLKETSLRNSRVNGVLCGWTAPQHIKLGNKKILYRKEVLDEWIDEIDAEM
jgi:predicted DNA-binding transcriptional regulator AlpA